MDATYNSEVQYPFQFHIPKGITYGWTNLILKLHSQNIKEHSSMMQILKLILCAYSYHIAELQASKLLAALNFNFEWKVQLYTDWPGIEKMKENTEHI